MSFSASIAIAQTEPETRMRATAVDLTAEIERAFDCDIVVHGTPRLDRFAGAWLVAYSANGAECDRAVIELASSGKARGIAFFRRPDLAQVKALISGIRRDLANAFGCAITFRGEPRFDEESAYWSISYLELGERCGDAEHELGRRGNELQINFMRIQTRRELVR